MPHVLILGQTESGKSTLAKQLAKHYADNGVDSLCLDPLHDPSWPVRFKTASPDEFLKAVWASRKCAVFVDEAGDMVGRYDTVMQQLATKGRHWGHNVHFLSQRGTQINMTVRDQCGQLFLFTTGQKDSKIHAEEWNQPKLLEAPQLPRGTFMQVDRYGLFNKRALF